MKNVFVHSLAHPGPLSESEGGRLAVEPLDPQVTSIQPGGGICMRIELAWGRLRRRYLKIFRRGYLARMEATREGGANRCPHEVLDPRDLKFYRNQGGYRWKPEDDPFVWREHLPFVREGLAELGLLFGLFVALAIGLGLVRWPLAVRAGGGGAIAGLVLPQSEANCPRGNRAGGLARRRQGGGRRGSGVRRIRRKGRQS